MKEREDWLCNFEGLHFVLDYLEVGSCRDGILRIAFGGLVLIATSSAESFSCTHFHELLGRSEPVSLLLLLGSI